jgi:hypothetical protein
MIKFIKKLLGLGPSELAKVQEARSVVVSQTTNTKETVKEILTPPVNETPVVAATYIEPVNKVKAISESGSQAVAAATAPKPANKKRRPYRGNKGASNAVAKESNTKGGNNVVKLQPVKVIPAKKK